MRFKEGYDIRRMDKFIELWKDGHLVHKSQSYTDVVRKYIELTEKKSKVEEQLKKINFPVEVVK